MAAENAKENFLGAGPCSDHGLVRRSVPPESYTPMKQEADQRRGPGMMGIKHSRSLG